MGLVLDFQDRGIVVQYSQDDLIHVLPETEVDFLLLFQSLDQLQDKKYKLKSIFEYNQAHYCTKTVIFRKSNNCKMNLLLFYALLHPKR